ncbi:hypothetical protein [Vibrio sp. D431a]|uniref:hypothetical protein n=1 Tax=Vibrio sp. D431a TaxID=2837388 RepID=UPI0025536661|nr:hypothetical protein [Vibrio sp. D431a]MDK9793323.1 hypothetical protein [Vibrio sp. D431a]
MSNSVTSKEKAQEFFDNLCRGDEAVSAEHGLVFVDSIETEDGKKRIFCMTDDDCTRFEVTVGQVSCPFKFQREAAISNCECRIKRGLDAEVSFKELRDALDLIDSGEWVYDF